MDLTNHEQTRRRKYKLNRQLQPLRYESLISAIPTKWKRMLNDNKTLNNNYLVFRDTTITINNTKR
jgi:hypothetical protein